MAMAEPMVSWMSAPKCVGTWMQDERRLMCQLWPGILLQMHIQASDPQLFPEPKWWSSVDQHSQFCTSHAKFLTNNGNLHKEPEKISGKHGVPDDEATIGHLNACGVILPL